MLPRTRTTVFAVAQVLLVVPSHTTPNSVERVSFGVITDPFDPPTTSLLDPGPNTAQRRVCTLDHINFVACPVSTVEEAATSVTIGCGCGVIGVVGVVGSVGAGHGYCGL